MIQSKQRKKSKQVAEELKIDNFPDAFKAKGELKNTQALVDYMVMGHLITEAKKAGCMKQ